jgi:hypothetical protein
MKQIVRQILPLVNRSDFRLHVDKWKAIELARETEKSLCQTGTGSGSGSTPGSTCPIVGQFAVSHLAKMREVVSQSIMSGPSRG